MKTLFACMALISSLSVLAFDKDYCKEETRFVGGENNIPVSCFMVNSEYSNQYNHRILSTLNLEVKALENIIFVKNLKTNTISRIAGEKTGLHQILAVDIDIKNELIYILNLSEEGSKMILSYKLSWQGNVYPFKTITKEHLPQDIKQIIIDPGTALILGLADSEKNIYSLSEGDSYHLNPELRPKLVSLYEPTTPVNYISADREGVSLLYREGNLIKFDNLRDRTLLATGNKIDGLSVDRSPAEYRNKEKDYSDE
jgi:hypothetical protein